MEDNLSNVFLAESLTIYHIFFTGDKAQQNG
jgi:hypothetical protein